MKGETCFIAMFENGDEPFYLANWEGDPGRTCTANSFINQATLLLENSKRFSTKKLAEKAINKAVKDFPNRNLVGKPVLCAINYHIIEQ